MHGGSGRAEIGKQGCSYNVGAGPTAGAKDEKIARTKSVAAKEGLIAARGCGDERNERWYGRRIHDR